MCSFVEIKEKLTLEDVYQILEADYVEKHNDQVAQRISIEKAEREAK